MDIESLKFPVGKYQASAEVSEDQFNQWVRTIESLPENLKKLVGNLSYEELEFQYRPGSWNIKQIIHHLADSHMNSFIRFKLVVSEEKPTIKPYQESEWAKTADADNEEINDSIEILSGLHNRWVMLLKSLTSDQKKRTFFHPEYEGELQLEWMVGLYDWHCRHHLAHIEQALKVKGEFTPEQIAEQ